MTLPVAAACRNALAAYADACKTPGDERTLDQRMADSFADLILRPGLNGPVQIALTLVAGIDSMTGGDEPAELDGHPIPAELARQLAHVLGLLPRPEADRGPRDRPRRRCRQHGRHGRPGRDRGRPDRRRPGRSQSGRSQSGRRRPGRGARAGRDGHVRRLQPGSRPRAPDRRPAGRTAAAALHHRHRAGPPPADRHRRGAHRPPARPHRRRRPPDRRHLRPHPLPHRQHPCTHPPTGPALGPPPPSPGYRPSDPLDRFVRARDRRCRFPGCRATAIRCDLDHNTPWPTGTTSADNLCCLCRHHHRLSHQAPGWTMHRLPDGGLQWTTPGGQTITTHPTPYGTDDLPPPVQPLEQAAHTGVDGDDPPPF